MLHLRVLTAVGLVAALAGCSSEKSETKSEVDVADYPTQNADLKPVAERQPAPEFAMKDADGNTVTVAGYKGKVVLLNFWATWCIPCRREMPWFEEFETKYKDRGFSVLGASMDSNGWEVVKPYITEHKLGYRIIVADTQMAQLYAVEDALPTTFMIDRQGRIAAMHSGLVSKSTFAKQIEELLEDKNAALPARPAAGELAYFRAK